MDFSFMCGICLSVPFRIFLTICYGLMTIFGGIGNVISIISIRKKNQNPNDREKIDQILLSLAVCDALVSIIIYPVYPWLNFWNYGPYNSFLMRLLAVLLLSFTSTSSLTIIMLAAIKYLKISKPTTFHGIITKNRFRIMMLLSWITPVCMFTPYLINKDIMWTINSLSFSVTITTIITVPIFYFLILQFFKKSTK